MHITPSKSKVIHDLGSEIHGLSDMSGQGEKGIMKMEQEQGKRKESRRRKEKRKKGEMVSGSGKGEVETGRTGGN